MTIKSDYEDTNNMDKFEVVKEQTRICLNMMQACKQSQAAEVNVAKILLGAAEEYLSHIHLC